MHKIQEVWKNKWKILSGIWNSKFGTKEIKSIAETRLSICQSNKCGFYDAEGKSENTFIKGEPACGVCGCNIKFLVNSLESKCSLQELGKEPLW